MADVKEIRSDEIIVFTEKKSKKGSTKIRIVDWIVEGKHYPLLEKREFMGPEGSDMKMGKAKGFNLADMMVVKENLPEIIMRLGDKPADEPKAARENKFEPIEEMAEEQY